MRRTQLYLDNDLWTVLHAKARTERTTVSELAREALREQYLGQSDRRKKAMLEFVGAMKRPKNAEDPVKIVRALRRGTRLERLTSG